MERFTYDLAEMKSSLSGVENGIGEASTKFKGIISKLESASEKNTAPAVKNLCDQVSEVLTGLSLMFNDMTRIMSEIVKSTETFHEANGGDF